MSLTSSPCPLSYAHIQPALHQLCGRPFHTLHPTLPFQYSGLDYALILHAIFPRDVVVLRQLCWADSPTPFQLDQNLTLFLTACHRLALEDAPSSTDVLSVATLRSEAANFVPHVIVQHWLWRLAERFPPEAAYNATELRSVMRREQLGDAVFERRPDAVGHCHVGVAGGDGASRSSGALLLAQAMAQQSLLIGQLAALKSAVVKDVVQLGNSSSSSSGAAAVTKSPPLPFGEWSLLLSNSKES